jgi:hypothetical protein
MDCGKTDMDVLLRANPGVSEGHKILEETTVKIPDKIRIDLIVDFIAAGRPALSGKSSNVSET